MEHVLRGMPFSFPLATQVVKHPCRSLLKLASMDVLEAGDEYKVWPLYEQALRAAHRPLEARPFSVLQEQRAELLHAIRTERFDDVVSILGAGANVDAQMFSPRVLSQGSPIFSLLVRAHLGQRTASWPRDHAFHKAFGVGRTRAAALGRALCQDDPTEVDSLLQSDLAAVYKLSAKQVPGSMVAACAARVLAAVHSKRGDHGLDELRKVHFGERMLPAIIAAYSALPQDVTSCFIKSADDVAGAILRRPEVAASPSVRAMLFEGAAVFQGCARAVRLAELCAHKGWSLRPAPNGVAVTQICSRNRAYDSWMLKQLGVYLPLWVASCGGPEAALATLDLEGEAFKLASAEVLLRGFLQTFRDEATSTLAATRLVPRGARLKVDDVALLPALQQQVYAAALRQIEPPSSERGWWRRRRWLFQ